MSLVAYQQAASRAENPRETEYRLFGEVTRGLMEAAKAPPEDLRARMGPLDLNRRLWSALASDCSAPTNGLPNSLKAHIISLSLWVGRHTSAVVRREESIEPLIEINRMIMQGLASRPEGA